jgi:N-acyl-L-homoserine lactone synthetase
MGQGDPTDPRAARQIDALTARLIARAAPIRFSLAATPEEREAAYRLRARIAVEKSWAGPEDLPGGMERDPYDEDAVHIVGWDGDDLVATARLVFPAPGRRLPTEEAFGIDIEPVGHVCDAGRFGITPPYRDPGHRIMTALLSRTWVEMRARGFHLCAAVASLSIVRLYRRFGLSVTILGPELEDQDERHPVLLDILGSAQSLADRWGV